MEANHNLIVVRGFPPTVVFADAKIRFGSESQHFFGGLVGAEVVFADAKIRFGSESQLFTYSGANPEETYFKNNKLLLGDGTLIPVYSVNTTNNTVVYMIPNDKEIESSQTFEEFDGFTCTVDVSNKTITFKN